MLPSLRSLLTWVPLTDGDLKQQRQPNIGVLTFCTHLVFPVIVAFSCDRFIIILGTVQAAAGLQFVKVVSSQKQTGQTLGSSRVTYHEPLRYDVLVANAQKRRVKTSVRVLGCLERMSHNKAKFGKLGISMPSGFGAMFFVEE